MKKTRTETAILFSPAVVLALWAIYIAAIENTRNSTVTICFLTVLAVCFAAAECVRLRCRARKGKNGNAGTLA